MSNKSREVDEAGSEKGDILEVKETKHVKSSAKSSETHKSLRKAEDNPDGKKKELERQKTFGEGVLTSNRPREEWDISHVKSTVVDSQPIEAPQQMILTTQEAEVAALNDDLRNSIEKK